MKRWFRLLNVSIILAALVLPFAAPNPASAMLVSTQVTIRLKYGSGALLYDLQYATTNLTSWTSPSAVGSAVGWVSTVHAIDGDTTTVSVFTGTLVNGWTNNFTATYASTNVVGLRFFVTGASEVSVDVYDTVNASWGNKFAGSCPLGTWVTIDLSETVVTSGVASIGASYATLLGTVTSLGTHSFAAVYFQYGTNTTYGQDTVGSATNITGLFNEQITGLLYNTTYHFRAVARFDATNYVFGQDGVFTTKPAEGSSTDIQIREVGVFSDYLESGDLLFAIETVNKYTGKYPGKKAGQIFTLQLLDTNNTDILAASPLPNWGDRPASIYLNAVTASTIVYGDAYYIKMLGDSSTSNATIEYTLTMPDWYGSDLTKLDSWCKGVANHMAASDSTNVWDYIRRVTDQGEMISDEVGGYFTTGIPGISQVRPNLFTTSQLKPRSPSGTANNTWDSLTAWQTYVGSGISADAVTLAAPFGLNGKDFMAGLIGLIILGFMMMVVGSTGGFGALGALLLAVPILWLGTYFRIVTVTIVIVMCIFFAVWAIRQFIIKTL